MSNQADPVEIRRVATMWAEIIRLQISRLEDAVDRYHAAVADEQLHAAIDTTGNPGAWAKVAREAHRSLTEQDLAAVAADKYFLLLATAQLNKCVTRLPHDGLPMLQDANMLRHLRNLEEHWEDPDGRSATALREQIPDIEPGRLHHNKDNIWFEGISVTSLLRWADDIDRTIRSTLADPGPTNP